MSGERNSVLFVHHRDISSSYSSTAEHYVSKKMAASATVHVLCHGRRDVEDGDGPPADVTYHTVDTGSIPVVSGVLFHVLCLLYGAALGLRYQYDAVYSFQQTVLQGWVAAMAGGSRFVVGLVSVPVRQKRDFVESGTGRDVKDRLSVAMKSLYAELFGAVLVQATAVVCLTEGIRQVTEEEYGVDLSDAFVIGMGVDVDTFAEGARRGADARNRDDDADLVVTYVGSIGLIRGIGDVIEAVAKSDHDVRFRIVGDGRDDTIDQLKSRARDLGVTDRVEFVGLVPHDEIPRVLGGTDVAVSPLGDIESFRISFPGKLLEYMAAGTVVVATDLPAHRQLLTHGENGLIYDGSTEELVRTLDACVEGTVDRRSLERGARATAAAHDWDVIVARHERVLFDYPVEQRRAAPVSA
ncbi:glycosyltransferase family 4 protein [Halosimplex sp. TS25]|uniref:glycosyltransferase family 4 protein n=1 Tax=Halosimplex rarum TaxID=3396619 RepID=UPI0039E74CA6